MEKKRKFKSALDEYINKVYILILLLVPGACQCAGLLYTVEKILGFFPTVNWTALIIFDLTCLLYLAIGIYFVKTGFADGLVTQKKLKGAKIFLVLIMFIQYNYILYLIPSTEFWGYALLFVIAVSFFDCFLVHPGRCTSADKGCAFYSECDRQTGMSAAYAAFYQCSDVFDQSFSCQCEKG